MDFAVHQRVERVILATADAFAGVDFGLFHLMEVAGTVFEDTNGDGVRQPGEPGLPGRVILLDRGPDGTTDATATTDANGDYRFTGLTLGTYRIREAGVAGWVATTADPADVVAQSGANVTGLDFGVFALGGLGGTVFDDRNGDGVRQPGPDGRGLFPLSSPCRARRGA